MSFLIALSTTFVGLFLVVPFLFALLRALGFYTIVEEGRCHVYVLFGKVLAVLDEPGLYFLWFKLGIAATVVNWLGNCHVLDLRLDQNYLRSQPVNSASRNGLSSTVRRERLLARPFFTNCCR